MKRFERKAEERGWNLTRLASEAGINRVTLSEIARGWRVPRAHHAARIAAALGWPLECAGDLMDEVDAP